MGEREREREKREKERSSFIPIYYGTYEYIGHKNVNYAPYRYDLFLQAIHNKKPMWFAVF